MHPETILDKIGAEQGWDDASKLAVCLDYIAAQQADDTFADHVRRQADEENKAAVDTGVSLADLD